MTGTPPELTVADAAAWSAWLDAHEDDSDGVWLVLARKGVTAPTSLSYDQALDHALCHGWIDGRKQRRDDSTFRQHFTPRRARSVWSQRNIGLVEGLIADGRMRPRGLAEIERAKADGRWAAAYAGQATMAVPDDLAAALAAEPRAAAMFAILTSQNRFAVLLRLSQAKRADTRARRLQTFVAMLAAGETLYPQKRGLAD